VTSLRGRLNLSGMSAVLTRAMAMAAFRLPMTGRVINKIVRTNRRMFNEVSRADAGRARREARHAARKDPHGAQDR
jgi:hypothetical protein